MLNSMVLCSFMLSNILRNGKTYVSEDEEAEFLYACRRFALGYAPGDTPPMPKRSFERYWETRCEADWRKAFRMFTYGVPMFLTTLTLSAWLKFWYSLAARLIVTLVAVLGVVIWFQTQRTWGAHLVKGVNDYSQNRPIFHPRVFPSIGTRDRNTRRRRPRTSSNPTETTPRRITSRTRLSTTTRPPREAPPPPTTPKTTPSVQASDPSPSTPCPNNFPFARRISSRIRRRASRQAAARRERVRQGRSQISRRRRPRRERGVTDRPRRFIPSSRSPYVILIASARFAPENMKLAVFSPITRVRLPRHTSPHPPRETRDDREG